MTSFLQQSSLLNKGEEKKKILTMARDIRTRTTPHLTMMLSLKLEWPLRCKWLYFVTDITGHYPFCAFLIHAAAGGNVKNPLACTSDLM